MKKKGILFFLILLSCQCVISQTKAKIRDVDFELVNNRIIVTYDISNPSPGELFTIELKFITGDNQEISPKTVTGDVGPAVPGGVKKTITWDIEKDQLEVSGTLTAIVTIKSSELPRPALAETPVERSSDVKLGGPSYALLSVLVPGLGGYFVEENKIRPAITTVTTVGLLAYGFYQKSLSNDYYADYESSDNPAVIQDYYDKANSAQHKFYISTSIAAAIWIADIIYVACKGSQNKKAARSVYHPLYRDGFKLYYADHQLQFGYSLKF